MSPGAGRKDGGEPGATETFVTTAPRKKRRRKTRRRRVRGEASSLPGHTHLDQVKHFSPSSPARNTSCLLYSTSSASFTPSSLLPRADAPSSSRSTSSHRYGDRQLGADTLRLRAGLFCVFPYLDVRSLLRAAEVCSDWRFVARHPAVWTRLRLESARVSTEVDELPPSLLNIIKLWKHSAVTLKKDENQKY